MMASKLKTQPIICTTLSPPAQYSGIEITLVVTLLAYRIFCLEWNFCFLRVLSIQF